MFIVAFSVLVLLSVVLAGGSLMRLADVRVRAGWLIGAAIVLQVLFITVFPHRFEGLHAPLHLATYGLAGAFMWANRKISGLWLIAAGGFANFVAIAANGGVMPASESALRAAGMSADKGEAFANSAALAEPKLSLLGDVFAIPEAWPLSNVFSVGDLLILAGLVVTLHALCQSRLAPAGARPFFELARQRSFTRVWAAQATSNLGDFAYSLAVAVGIVQSGGGATLLATVLIVQAGPAIVAGLVGAPLVDRLSRRRLMVAADLARAVAVGSLVLAGTPSTAHVLAVAACLGAFGAVFQPALQASLPNLVPERLLMTANATISATFHVAILAGPVLGGLLATAFGATAAFGLNALTFLISAALLAGVPIAQARAGEDEEAGLGAVLAGLRFAAGSAVVRVVVVGAGAAMLAATLKQPLEPVYILRDLDGLARDIGLAAGAWGLGMILGSVAAPALGRRLRREGLMVVGTAAMGVAVAGAAGVGTPGSLLSLWLLAGAGNALLSVAYETLLLERTPDRLRGRVVAANEAGLDLALLVGLGLAGVGASLLGTRGVYLLSGVLLLAVALGLAVAFRRTPAAGLVVRALEEHDVGERVLLRVAGEWHGPGAVPVLLRVSGEDGPPVEIEPLPAPAAADDAPWRAAFAPLRAELRRPGVELALVAGPHVVALRAAA